MTSALVAFDLLTVLLVCGVLVLVVSTTVMLMNVLPGSTRRTPRPPALSAGAAQAVAVARARATAASAELAPRPVGERSGAAAGQIIDLPDGPDQDRQMSVEHARAIATHFAENDPQRVAEVITEWIRADLSNGLEGLR